MLQIELTMSDPDRHRVICTDFGATLHFGLVEKGNCSVDNHAVMCIFLWLVIGEKFNLLTHQASKTVQS